MDYVILIVLFLILMYIYYYSELNTEPISLCYNNLCRKFNVHATFSDRHRAAKIIAELDNKVNILLAHLNKKYDCVDAAKDECEKIDRLRRGYNAGNIYEISPHNSFGFTSYTENKGDKLVLCLRDKDGKLHDINTLTFVTLHEISHIMNKHWGHGFEFWEVFRFILRNGIECGIYTPVDYSLNPVEYCGMMIDSSPIY